MTLELEVQTDPGEQGKKILIDGSLKGSSSGSGSNIESLLREYMLDGRRIMGTKAVVINLAGFLEQACERYSLGREDREEIASRFGEVLTLHYGERGYWSGFWDKTSEVHHRDIMRWAYGEVRKAVVSYEGRLNKADFETEEEAGKLLEKIEKLRCMAGDMEEALEQLYIIKIGDSKLSRMAVRMLEYSQGYQLSSENIDNSDNLWKSRVLRLQLHSAITKDQAEYGVPVRVEETEASINYFVGLLQAMEIGTNEIEVPLTHRSGREEFKVESTRVHRKGDGRYLPLTEEKRLRVTYVN